MKTNQTTTCLSEWKQKRREMWECWLYAIEPYVPFEVWANRVEVRAFLDWFLSKHPRPKPTTPERIIKTVCKVYGISKKRLMAKTNKQPMPEARYVCAHFMNERTDLSKTAIGRILNIDHSTVMHGVNTTPNYPNSIPNRLQFDGDLRTKVNEVRRLLRFDKAMEG